MPHFKLTWPRWAKLGLWFLLCLALGQAKLWAVAPLTLEEVLQRLEQNPKIQESLAKRLQAEALRKAAADDNRTSQKAYLDLSHSTNEVADQQDLTASATKTNQAKLGYQITFANGLKLDVFSLVRPSQALDDQGEDSTFTKSLAVASFPLLGPSTGRGFALDQRALQSSLAELQVAQEKSNNQISTVRAFLGYHQSHQVFSSQEKLLLLTEKKLNLVQSIKKNLTPIEERHHRVERLQASQKLVQAQADLEAKRYALEQLIGNLDPQRPPVLPDLEFEPPGLAELKQHYLAHSFDLKQKKLLLEIKRTEIKRAELSTEPEVSLGAFVGTSRLQSPSLDNQGANQGLFASVSVGFGGGEAKDLKALRLDLEVLEQDYAKARQQTESLAESRMNSYLSSKKLLAIRKEQVEIATELIKLQENSPNDALQISLMEEERARSENLTDLWLKFLDLMEGKGLVSQNP